MTRLFKVVGVHPTGENICLDEQNKKHIIDLLVDGTMPKWVESSKDLVGMEVMIDDITPHITIASNPQIVVRGRESSFLQTNNGMKPIEKPTTQEVGNE